jgi:hypothetical protein
MLLARYARARCGRRARRDPAPFSQLASNDTQLTRTQTAIQQNNDDQITMMMNRTIAVASRLATKTSWKSKALQQQYYRSYVSPTPFVNAAAAAVEDAGATAPKTTTKKKTSKKSDEEKANKHMLVSIIAQKHEVSLAEAGRILDTVTETIVDVRIMLRFCYF